ncbi:MAG: glycosyltransferase [Lachnospiraceae bacterium]|nr:glycosyltransferase [Lachnospiraceae bacterium]
MIKKVLFHLYSLQKGGAERVVTTLAGEMKRQGLEVTIATLVKGEVEYPLPEGVKRVVMGLSPEEEKSGKLSRMRLRVKHLRDCLREEKPDVVFSFMQSANYRAIIAARPLHIPVIFSVRSDPRVDYASRSQKFISGYLYPRAAGGVFQTRQAMDFFPETVKERSRVILNPLDPRCLSLERFSEEGILTDSPEVAESRDGLPRSATGGRRERRKVYVAVGRHHKAKDYLTLVKAFEIFSEKHPEYKLEIYGGDSGDNTRLQVAEYVHGHEMDEKVLFMGDRSNVAECIRDAAVYVLSSRYEGMPNALMEAMSLGLPVIATDCPCGGPASLISDGENGLLSEPENPKELAAAMCKMADYPEEAERVAKEAVKIREIASAERITKEWLAFAEERMKS